MANTSVVYYSLSGTTRKVAQQVAELLGADIDGIEDANPRRGMLGYPPYRPPRLEALHRAGTGMYLAFRK